MRNKTGIESKKGKETTSSLREELKTGFQKEVISSY